MVKKEGKESWFKIELDFDVIFELVRVESEKKYSLGRPSALKF